MRSGQRDRRTYAKPSSWLLGRATRWRSNLPRWQYKWGWSTKRNLAGATGDLWPTGITSSMVGLQRQRTSIGKVENGGGWERSPMPPTTTCGRQPNLEDHLWMMTPERLAMPWCMWMTSWCWPGTKWECDELTRLTTTSPLRFLGMELHLVDAGYELGQKGFTEEVVRSHGHLGRQSLSQRTKGDIGAVHGGGRRASC